MAKAVYAIEGLDRLGKSTLIEGILQREGFYQVVHFSKPQALRAYERAVQGADEAPIENFSKYLYQRESFINSMIMAQSGARLIYDRWHLGEAVYAPLYRKYSGDYVFELERGMHLGLRDDVRLILLVEDFDRSIHFKSDGDSFDDMKRREEQELFVKAFQESVIKDKRIICVTALSGEFRPKQDILEEALR